ncbi:hypothetical protein C8R44DRAFT_865531 [Mycena epipterygia]|nr:hypothetical protein C8R44DRAFT_865531 [Mycena epipterygia]
MPNGKPLGNLRPFPANKALGMTDFSFLPRTESNDFPTFRKSARIRRTTTTLPLMSSRVAICVRHEVRRIRLRSAILADGTVRIRVDNIYPGDVYRADARNLAPQRRVYIRRRGGHSSSQGCGNSPGAMPSARLVLFAFCVSIWMSHGTIFIPSSDILAAYTDAKELGRALGIYLLIWDSVTLFSLCVSISAFVVSPVLLTAKRINGRLVVIRSSVAYSLLRMLGFSSVALACLAGGQFSESLMVTKVGGAFGIIGALIAYYIAISALMASAIVSLPLVIWR